jgi:hypothetical protein
MWGPKTLKSLVASGELGDLITIESRYWQPSVAYRVLFQDLRIVKLVGEIT